MVEVVITLNEAGLRTLLKSPTGPLGQYVNRKAIGVTQRALINAGGGGPGPQIRSGDLLRHTRNFPVHIRDRELQAVVASDAQHDGFQYPVAQELGGYTPSGTYYRYPFLEPALAAEFNQPYRG